MCPAFRAWSNSFLVITMTGGIIHLNTVFVLNPLLILIKYKYTKIKNMSASPEPTVSIGLTFVQIIISIFSAIMVAIQVYLVNKVDKARLNIERFSGITEKFGLEIKPIIEMGNFETIAVNNKGTIPVDEILMKINLRVERRKGANLPLNIAWSRKALLDANEITKIPLHDKLWPFLEQNNLVKLVEEAQITTDDPETGENVDDYLYTGHLEKQFSVLLDITVALTIQKEITTIRKKYRLHYSWRMENIPSFEDDYIISISEDSGEWVPETQAT